MPKHRYYIRNDPPTFKDRLFEHPFEISCSVLWIVFGVASIVSSVTAGVRPTMALEPVAFWAMAALGVSSLLAAVETLRGLLVDHEDDMSVDWRRERTGLAIGAVTMTGFAVAVLWSHPTSLLSWVTPLTIAIACGLRVWATICEERERRKEVAIWRTLGGVGG